MNSAINKANEQLNFVSQDKEFLRAYHMREMALSDWTTGINTGIEKGKIEVANNMLHEGLSMDMIQKITGLNMDTIQSICKQCPN